MSRDVIYTKIAADKALNEYAESIIEAFRPGTPCRWNRHVGHGVQFGEIVRHGGTPSSPSVKVRNRNTGREYWIDALYLIPEGESLPLCELVYQETAI